MNIMSKSKKAKTSACTATTAPGPGRNTMVNGVRERRLMKELQDITTNATTFTVDLVNDNLFEWHVCNVPPPHVLYRSTCYNLIVCTLYKCSAEWYYVYVIYIPDIHTFYGTPVPNKI